MILLTTTAHPTMRKWRHPNHGRLLTPRHWSNVEGTVRDGTPWAIDNDGFNGFRPDAFRRMVLALSCLPGCLFVNAPDVFDRDAMMGDHAATLALFEEWQPLLAMTGLPVSFVLQNGATPRNVPWNLCDAVFIGGEDRFKLGPEGAALAREARRRGKHVHMGRVNSEDRIWYAHSIGCDSIDGTGWAKYRDAMLPRGLRALGIGQQLRMDTIA